VYPLAAPARARRDTLYLPLQFVSEALPRLQAQHFSYDPATARLTDRRAAVAAAPEAAPAGRHRAHRVAIDPGHGGVDPGNPGLYFPAGLREKDVNLAVGLLLRDLLQSRGVEVVMTRTRDTLIDLRHRGRYCSEDCALFVSLHVNSLPRRRGYTSVRGFETYFLAEARTEDAARVARMENEAIRFETPDPETAGLAGLDFILKDLMVNEYLRESGRMASLIQAHVGRVHSGDNRGVKQAGLMVLTTARRPAVLFEMGFSTNRQDARLMTDTASQRKLATALADAIVEYLREYERRTDADSATNRDGLDGR
jgi:N-acetylmuramoyl-L-alanine amidase